MAKTRSWEVSDELWKQVEPLIPKRRRERGRKFIRAVGGGRKPLEPRRIFEGIVYVLRTGCQWKALNKERFGAPSSIHHYFQQWMKSGFFLKLWKAGLAEYDDMEAIAWRWQSIDGSLIKAPLARDCVGPNPTDRGKKWNQAQPTSGRAWHPAVARRRGRQCERPLSANTNP